jgi:pyridoxamine 5'-phosphate oxidase
MVDPPVPLLEEAVDPSPLVQFGRWFEEVASVMESPEAMAVASVDDRGRPSARMVLLKAWGEDGFTFFTNYDSRKGHELEAGSPGALLFYWEPLGRQIRIEGHIEVLGSEGSDAYFATRQRGSQIGARASQQSEPVASRLDLEARVGAVEAEYEGRDVPRPGNWGGLTLVPDSFEFWQHRSDRLHDRLSYRRTGPNWEITRLQP